jgi:hypothetical protein
MKSPLFTVLLLTALLSLVLASWEKDGERWRMPSNIPC